MQIDKVAYRTGNLKRGKPISCLFLNVFFFAGLLLQVCAIIIYHKTIIDWKITTGLWLITGIITQRAISGLLDNYHKMTNYFLQLFFCVCAFGGIISYLFLATNYYVSGSATTETVKAPILKTGHLAKGRSGCESPFANVEIYNTDKQLVFPCSVDIQKYQFVTLTTKKGCLGFYLILDKTLSYQ